MGTKGREIVGMNVEELLTLLNKAYADEWLAYYQYWLGAKIVRGPMKDAVAAELLLHAGEELAHADMLALRIIQLGGTPLVSPENWFKRRSAFFKLAIIQTPGARARAWMFWSAMSSELQVSGRSRAFSTSAV